MGNGSKERWTETEIDRKKVVLVCNKLLRPYASLIKLTGNANLFVNDVEWKLLAFETRANTVLKKKTSSLDDSVIF